VLWGISRKSRALIAMRVAAIDSRGR